MSRKITGKKLNRRKSSNIHYFSKKFQSFTPGFLPLLKKRDDLYDECVDYLIMRGRSYSGFYNHPVHVYN